MKKRILVPIFFALAFFASNANAWFFFFIPGSVTRGISDSFTGAKGNICVGENAKAGDTLPSTTGNIAKVVSVSGTSSMCQNPALPIRAEVEFQITFNSKAGINLPEDYESKPITDLQRFNGMLLRASSKTAANTGVLVFAVKRTPNADLASIANAAEKRQINALEDAKSSNPEQFVINGAKALRFEVNGKLKGLFGSQMTYLITFIEGDSEIVIVNAFSPSFSDEEYKRELKKFAEGLTGIKIVGDTPPAGLANSPNEKGIASPASSLSIFDAPSPTELPSSALPQSESVANRLRELNRLYKEGVINEKEFETKKQELLNKM